MSDDLELSPEEEALLAEAAASPTTSKSRARREAVQTQAEGPYLGHPLAPPAQMSYPDDPWGGLPVQMRHDADGNPVH